MTTTASKNQMGFTLIELLAVMAIVAVLAGIVAVSVSGSGETSRDAQIQQDANTVETSASDFFSDQGGAELLTPKTVTVFNVGGIEQITSSRWPENYISEVYPDLFLDESEGASNDTVGALLLLEGEDSTTFITPKRLLENFNAIDFAALSAGGYLVDDPDGVSALTADLYPNYLWLFKRTNAAGSSTEGAARQVVVFKLRFVEDNEIDSRVGLTYVLIVGDISEDIASNIPSNVPPLPDDSIEVSATEDVPKEFPLVAFDEDISSLTYDLVEGEEPSHGILLGLPGVGTPTLVTYLPEANYNGPDSFQFSVSDGEFTNIATVSITVAAVNDPPFFDPITDPPAVSIDTSFQQVAVTGVAAGPPGAEDETETVIVTALVISETSTCVISNPEFLSGFVSYVPLLLGSAVIEVKADDGQATFTRTFNVNVTPPPTLDIVVPNNLALLEGTSDTNMPFDLAALTLGSARYQQIYLASEFALLTGPPHTITQISFRPDGSLGTDFSSVLSDIEIRLSTTSGPLSSTFSDNLVGSGVLVFSGPTLFLSSLATGPVGGPQDFDIVIELQTPFPYQPSDGNLVLDIQNFLGGSTTHFDAVFSGLPTLATGHISASVVSNTTAGTGSQVAGGLVTQFSFLP